MSKQTIEKMLDSILEKFAESVIDGYVKADGNYQYETDPTIKELEALCKEIEQQAYEKAKMELEVKIGLQGFGQLMQEKEAIIQQARKEGVESFAKWVTQDGQYGTLVGSSGQAMYRNSLRELAIKFLEENPST